MKFPSASVDVIKPKSPAKLVPKNLAPNDIFSGRIDYSDDQFRKDVFDIQNWHLLDKKDKNSLNTLLDNIIDDIKTNEDPEDFLKQFYKLFYYKLDSGEGDNVAIINDEFLVVSKFTYYVYLLYASKLRVRFQKNKITKNEYGTIKKKYIDSFREFMEEWEIHESSLTPPFLKGARGISVF